MALSMCFRWRMPPITDLVGNRQLIGLPAKEASGVTLLS
jgi:hypothetical protein